MYRKYRLSEQNCGLVTHFEELVFKPRSFDLRHVSVVFESGPQCLPTGEITSDNVPFFSDPPASIRGFFNWFLSALPGCSLIGSTERTGAGFDNRDSTLTNSYAA